LAESPTNKLNPQSRPERPSWDQYFMTITREVAERSTCLRAQVGAVIVRDRSILATGYNGSPAGLPHCTEVGCLIYESRTPDGEVEQNCYRTIHAEINAISQAARNLACLLKPGARVLLCMVGRFSLWEMAWQFAQGKPALALHSFRRKPTTQISAQDAVLVHYPSVSDMRRMFAPEFRLRGWTGVGVAVPPSCLEPVARRVPGVVGGLAKIDRYLNRAPGFRSLADCVLLQFERLGEEFPPDHLSSS